MKKYLKYYSKGQQMTQPTIEAIPLAKITI